MPRQSTLGFFNRTLSYTSTCTEDNERLRLRVKSMFDKPFSNAVHPENRARKKLRQTFYHSALFVSEKKKKIRGIAMSVRGLSRWIIGSFTSSSRWIIISSSGDWKKLTSCLLYGVVYFILIIAKIEDRIRIIILSVRKGSDVMYVCKKEKKNILSLFEE